MSLQLNDKEPFKEYPGKNTEQMPLLVKDGRIPLSVAGLMRRRLEVLEEKIDPAVRKGWWGNFFDTGDMVAYDPQGNVKVVPDAIIARRLSPQSRLSNGALVLEDSEYEALDGIAFTVTEKAKYTGNTLSAQEAKKNQFWRALARDDQTLLNAYVDAAFARARQFNYDKAMGVYVAQPQKAPTARVWCVGGDFLSVAGGDGSLDDVDGRLVGVVAPKAQ